MKEIIKKSSEIIFQCPKCTCMWKEDKRDCRQQEHDGMIDAICYLSSCPECWKEVSILEVYHKNGENT